MPAKSTVIVSGGTYGIGRGITLALAEQGWNVVAFGLEAKQLGSAATGGIAATRAALAQAGLGAELLEADVSDSEQVASVVAHAKDHFGAVNALVNNAAIRPSGTILDTDEATFERVLAVNLKGMFLLAKAAIPHFLDAGGGAIVNIGSGAGWGKPGILAYGASKGGVFAFSSALAYDHLKDHIRVNLVIPGPATSSGMVEELTAANPAAGAPATVTGRATQPSDVAAAVAFLLSDGASQISGTIIDVGAFAHQGGAGQPR